MGASLVYLNEPNKEIEHDLGKNDYLNYAAANMQGWRLNMVSSFHFLILFPFQEDAHIANEKF